MPADDDGEDADGEPGLGILSVGALIHAFLSLKGALKRWLKRFQERRVEAPAQAAPWSAHDRPFDIPFLSLIHIWLEL